MGFTYPWFLFALALLAIPILVHLFHFRRIKTTLFSNIRFLKDIQQEKQNTQKLKHLLILCSRCLALICLIFAFTLPYCGSQKKLGNGKKAIVLFLDNSLSMELKSSSGIAFEEAKEQARKIIKSYGNTAEFQISSHNASGKQLQFLSSSEALEIVDKLQITQASVPFSKVWKLAQEKLNEKTNAQKLFYLISDFQKSFFLGIDDLNENKNIEVFALQIEKNEASNIALDSTWLENPYASVGENNRLFFLIHNYSKKSFEDFGVKLSLNNNLTGTASVNLTENSIAKGSIAFTMPSNKIIMGKLEIEDANQLFDNSLFFTLYPQTEIPVAKTGSELPYINSFFKASPVFNSQNQTIEEALTSKNQAVVFQNITDLNPAQSEKLNSFVSNGGRAVLIPADNINPENLYFELSKFIGLPKIKKTVTNQLEFSKNSLQHQFYNSIFEQIPKNIELPETRKYYSTAGSTGSGEAIISLENGDPYLIQISKGAGKLFVFLGNINIESSNFTQSSLFLPILTKCLLRAESKGQLYAEVASNKPYVLNKKFNQKENNLKLTFDQFDFFPELANGVFGQQLYIGKHLDKSGFYNLKNEKNPEEEEIIALNASRIESNTASIEKSELEKWKEKLQLKLMNKNEVVKASTVESKNSNLWKLFVILALIFLFIEILLILYFDKFKLKQKLQTST